MVAAPVLLGPPLPAGCDIDLPPPGADDDEGVLPTWYTLYWDAARALMDWIWYGCKPLLELGWVWLGGRGEKPEVLVPDAYTAGPGGLGRAAYRWSRAAAAVTSAAIETGGAWEYEYGGPPLAAG